MNPSINELLESRNSYIDEAEGNLEFSSPKPYRWAPCGSRLDHTQVCGRARTMTHSSVWFPFQHTNAYYPATGKWVGVRKRETPGKDKRTAGNTGLQCLQHVPSSHCCSTGLLVGWWWKVWGSWRGGHNKMYGGHRMERGIKNEVVFFLFLSIINLACIFPLLVALLKIMSHWVF